MEKEIIQNLVASQREYFNSNKTLDVSNRINALKKLKETIIKYHSDIERALQKDLGKSAYESYMCEINMTLDEINYMLKHIKSFAKVKRVPTPATQFAAKSFIKPSPYGVMLIMSPWNYPFMLALEPLVDALAAGNTAIIKPSAYSVHTSEVIKKLIEDAFPPEYVAVVTGGREENTHLLQEHFDYICFTGSIAVGKRVMRAASNYLTPVTLELGGKSPCIVEKSADIKLAAKRIVFGKYLNCGQTCVAPDYIYCDSSIKDELIKELKAQITAQYGEKPLENENYGKIINDKHYRRILGLIDPEKVVAGSKFNDETLRIEPTVLDNVTFDDAVMQEEIFGPVLPILTYESLDDVITKVNSMPHPLALYIFTSNNEIADKVTSLCRFGGGCINDAVSHLATSEMGFGGFGDSGMGSYHGEAGFRSFSHYKSIMDKKTWFDLPFRYQPFTSTHDGIMKSTYK